MENQDDPSFFGASTTKMANPVSAGSITTIFNIFLIYIFPNSRAFGPAPHSAMCMVEFRLMWVKGTFRDTYATQVPIPNALQLGHCLNELVASFVELGVSFDFSFPFVHHSLGVFMFNFDMTLNLRLSTLYFLVVYSVYLHFRS